jgi:hypothetical protein
MHIKSSISIALWIVATIALCASPAWARGGGPHKSGGPSHQKNRPNNPDATRGEKPNHAEVRPNAGPDRRRNQRPCRAKARRGVPGGCYLSDNEWVEDIESSANEAPPAARQDSNIAPVTRVPSSQDGKLNVIAPAGNAAMKDELIAARRNWLKKKQIAEDAAAERARAEYKSSKEGSTVDPMLIERQNAAEKQELEAHQAIGPVIERARAAGFSSETLEIYERASRGY